MSIFRGSGESENPYYLTMMSQDARTKNLWRVIYQIWAVAIGATIGLIIVAAILFYKVNDTQEFHHFIMLDRDYQPVEAIARRADIMADSDPIKEGITANFLKDYVRWTRERMMDDAYLTRQLNQARLQVAGIATVKFKTDLEAVDPWKQNKREKVLVDIEGLPMRVSMDGKTKTWLVNWVETVQDTNGTVLRKDKRNGHFLLAEDSRRVSTENPFGLVVVDQEYK